ncbi:DUF4123 domain-containing protein [Rhizobium sp. CNPSo 4039]|uniref:DUF4123 domain-containing protein n=1 Tax=Rhizobium sp. CNPSo 4039 TaxID=3021409 RepID=UPI00254D6C96|nr:DUF4123 domain-containing protein [Rhizobium sp. CNPSo 4039]MDK4715923.1 DUF4123 domain-containing protein [Rhizobium sp. CNPSo 4039]
MHSEIDVTGRKKDLLPDAEMSILEGYRKMPQPVYAVMDGANFFDLPKALEDEGIYSRSLFLEHADEEIARAAGWLVPIDDESMLRKVLGLSKAVHSMALWSSAAGEDRLFRHLRSINLILIPDDDEPPTDGEQEPGGTHRGEQSVLFRHYDPEVLNSVVPLLTQDQFIRLMGPCDQVMWYASEYGGRRRAVKPVTDAVMPRGPLRLSDEQIEELEANRKTSSQMKTVRYLRETEPLRTSQMTDAELRRYTIRTCAEGEELGLRTERGLALWAYLQLHSGGKVGRDPGLRGYLRSFPEDGTPDDKVYALMTRLSKIPASK